MHSLPNQVESSPRPSRFIAEALVGRHSPGQIAARANDIGLPKSLTKVIVAACAATATDAPLTRARRFAAPAN